jgi:hypothetical protein
MLGGGAVTVKVTGTVCGVLVAPVAVIVIAALYIPAARVPVVTLSVAEPLPVPAAGLRVSQDELSLTLQLSVPPPVLLIFND